MMAGSSIVTRFTTRFVEQRERCGHQVRGGVILRLSLAPYIITAQRILTDQSYSIEWPEIEWPEIEGSSASPVTTRGTAFFNCSSSV